MIKKISIKAYCIGRNKQPVNVDHNLGLFKWNYVCNCGDSMKWNYGMKTRIFVLFSVAFMWLLTVNSHQTCAMNLITRKYNINSQLFCRVASCSEVYKMHIVKYDIITSSQTHVCF